MNAPVTIERPVIGLVDRVGFVSVWVAAWLGPFMFGSVSGLATLFLGLVLAVALGSTSVRAPREGTAARLFDRTLVFMALFTAYAAFQSWSGVPSFLANPIWAEASRLIGPLDGSISVVRGQPLRSVGYVIMPLAAFAAALRFTDTDERLETAWRSFVIAMTGLCLVTLVLYGVAPGQLLWETKRWYTDSFTLSFVNRNTAATMLGVTLLLAVALAHRESRHLDLKRLLLGSNVRLGERERRERNRMVLFAGCAAVLGIGLFLTRSRAGILCSFAGFTVYAVGMVLASGRWTWKRALAVVGGLSAILFVFYIFGGQVLYRVEKQGLVDEGRLCTYLSTWRIFLDNMWFGTGLGTFYSAFPPYRDPACGLYGFWAMAHSTWLEGLQSLGLPFVLFAGWALFELARTYRRGLRERRRFRFAPLVGLSACVIAFSHAAVDFSLQIPGFAIPFATLLGSAAAASLRRSGFLRGS